MRVLPFDLRYDGRVWQFRDGGRIDSIRAQQRADGDLKSCIKWSDVILPEEKERESVCVYAGEMLGREAALTTCN